MAYIQYICVIVSISAINCASIQSSECDQLLATADDGLNKIMFFSDDSRINFSSVKDLKETYCDMYPTYLKMATNYTRCLKSFSRSLLNLVAANVKKIHKQICFNKDKLEEAYSHVKCMDSSNKESMQKVGQMGVSMVSYVSELKDLDDIIPGMCCGVREYLNKTVTLINEVCTSKTGPGTGQFLSFIMRNIFGDVTDMMCGKYPDEVACEKEKPELFKNLKLSLEQYTPRNHSFAYPTVKVLERLESITI